jgi:hypothetical protein
MVHPTTEAEHERDSNPDFNSNGKFLLISGLTLVN